MESDANVVSQKNVDQLTRSLERLSLYDGKGNKKNLNIQISQSLQRILGGLTMKSIEEQMYILT